MSKMGSENTTMLCFPPFQLITASINFKNYQMPSHPHTEDRAKRGGDVCFTGPLLQNDSIHYTSISNSLNTL